MRVNSKGNSPQWLQRSLVGLKVSPNFDNAVYQRVAQDAHANAFSRPSSEVEFVSQPLEILGMMQWATASPETLSDSAEFR